MTGRVYVSSTYEDLKEYRVAVLAQLRKLDMVDVAMEHYSSEERGPLKRCLEDVGSCDLHVMVVAWRYGFIPKEETQSITELEYREAGKHGIERLVFLLDENAPWQRRWMDTVTGEGERGKRINDLRRELAETHHLTFFATKEQLASALATAVAQWQRQRLRAEKPKSAPARDALRDYLESQIELDAPIESRYVELRGTTQVAQAVSSIDWPAALLPAAFRAIDLPAEVQSGTQDLEDVERGLGLHRRFVLLGSPGSGKTTTLLRVRLNAARAALADPSAPVPLFIRLPEWPPSITDFSSFLVHERQAQGVPLVNPSRLLLLLDGLNEIDPESYELRVSLLEEWLQQNPTVRVVVSSRVRHYQQYPQLSLSTVRIHPLDEIRIQEFAGKFLGAQKGRELVSLLDEGLLHVAHNPFLLGLLCYVYQRRGGQLPRTRGDLLQTATRSLYQREVDCGNAAGISFEALREALGNLALGIVQGRAATSVSLEWASKRLPAGVDANQLVGLAVNADLIALSKNDRFLQFSHQLFLEHFAAEHLARHPERLGTAIPAPGFADGDRVARPFDEVVYALVELDDPTAVLSDIAAHDPFLAAEALDYAKVSTVASEVVDIIVTQLLQQLDEPDDDRRTAAVARLVRLGEIAVPGLQHLLGRGELRARRLAVSALGRIGSLDALTGLVDALRDRARWVRRDAERILSSLDEEERALMARYLAERLPAHGQDERTEIANALARCFVGQDPALLADLRQVVEIEDFLPEPGDVEVSGVETAALPEPVEEPFDLGQWGHAWVLQWREDPGNVELARQARRGLRGAPPEDRSWGYVWWTLWQFKPGDEQLVQRGREWLAVAPPQHNSWGYVWQTLWEFVPGDEHLVRRGREWLGLAPEHGSWGYVWRRLWQAYPGDEELAGLAATWLRIAPPEHGSWSLVWVPLWATQPGDPDLAAKGRVWLREVLWTNRSWGYVWSALWERNPGDPELERIGYEWLEEVPCDHRSWPFLFRTLGRRASQDPELEQRGRVWLRTSLAADGWSQLWQALWSVNLRDPELEELAHRWLAEGSESRHSWGYVWRGLWQGRPNDPGLAAQGIRWLGEVDSDHPTWVLVWRALSALQEDVPELTAAAARWLRAAPLTQRDWGDIWAGLAEHGRMPPDLERLGSEWVRSARVDASGWGKVFRAVRACEVLEPPSDEEILTALRGLRKGSEEWTRLLESLWISGVGRETLASVTRRFLAGSPDQRQWPFLWHEIADAVGTDPDLLTWGRRWIEQHPPTRPGWALVWKGVVAALPGDDEILKQGWRWMEPEFAGRASWPQVWQVLWERTAERNRLVRVAREWLSSQPPLRRGASQLWLSVWPSAQGDEALRSWAAAFLRATYDHADRSKIAVALQIQGEVMSSAGYAANPPD